MNELKQIPPIAIECENAGSAMTIQQLARQFCLSASYHPHGGETARRNVPVSHTVWIMGSEAAYKKFRKAVIKRSETS